MNRKVESSSLLDKEELEAEWKLSPTPEVAAEIVALSTLTGRSTLTDDAAALLQRSRKHLTPGAEQILRAYQGADEPATIELLSPQAQLTLRAGQLRRRVRAYPRDAVGLVELALHQSILGQPRAARRSLKVALALAPHNRYVLRSSARFFVHDDDLDMARWVLRNIGDQDPWLLASHIAVLHLADSPQTKVRSARYLIDGRLPAHTTELSSALATLEMDNGSFKNSRKLFRHSSISPNDNSVAQIRWASDIAGLPFNKEMLETELSFEARTVQAAKERDWSNAIRNAEKWILDEPFSTRAASIGSFYASEVTKEYEKLEWFSEAALLVKHNSPTFLNNRAFAKANLGRLPEAQADVDLARSHHPGRDTTIYLTATEGCIRFRSGDTAGGRQRYIDAIEMARAIDDAHALRGALVHLVYEERRAGTVESVEVIDEIARLLRKAGGAEPDFDAVVTAHLGPDFASVATQSAARPALAKSVFEPPSWTKRL